MRHLAQNRRGSVAFATVIAMVPLMGFIALGAEATSWYVTKQQAQNAADAAALSGAFWLACKNSSTPCELDPAHDYVYRGKQFAAQSAFCNSGESYAGCPASLPSGTSRTVQIDRGTYNAGANSWTSSASGDSIRAIVGQTQPAYLAAILGLSTVAIPATAIAQVGYPKQVCTLALAKYPPNGGSLKLAGGLQIKGNGCELMSDDTVQYSSAPSFQGTGWAVGASNGCSGPYCALSGGVPYNYSLPPATNPLQQLDTASFNSRTGNTKPCSNGHANTNDLPCTLDPLSTGAYGSLTVGGGSVTFNPGTYFFYNANITINGGTVSCACTPWPTNSPPGTGLGVTIVLLGNSSISITGGNVNLSAPYTNTTSTALSGVLIDDQAPNRSNNAVTINGGGNVKLGGAMYLPNVDVTWSGTAQNTNTRCSEVIANTVTMGGTAYMSSTDCIPSTIPSSQVVKLVH